MSRATSSRYRAYGKIAFAALLALTFCMAHPSSTAYAKKRKLAKYGSIKILSTPGGWPIEIDGKPEGLTSTDYRAFDRDPGLHTVVITLPNGQRWTREIDLQAGRIKCVAISFKASPPTVKSPCPYPVILSVDAEEINSGETITFTAAAAYDGDGNALNYHWKISPSSAQITTSVGNRITVDSTGVAAERITATVTVDDGSGEEACRQTKDISVHIRPPEDHESPSKQFDVCCSCSFDDQKARLDNLGVELQNDPSATTYVIAYGGRSSRAGQADLLGTRARDYLVEKRAIDRSRIMVLNGGYREEDCVELWIVPKGAAPPQATPTAGEVRPDTGTPRRRRRGRD